MVSRIRKLCKKKEETTKRHKHEHNTTTKNIAAWFNWHGPLSGEFKRTDFPSQRARAKKICTHGSEWINFKMQKNVVWCDIGKPRETHFFFLLRPKWWWIENTFTSDNFKHRDHNLIHIVGRFFLRPIFNSFFCAQIASMRPSTKSIDIFDFNGHLSLLFSVSFTFWWAQNCDRRFVLSSSILDIEKK